MYPKKYLELAKDFLLLIYLFAFSTLLMSIIWLYIKFGKISLDQFLIHLEIVFFNQIGNNINLKVTKYSQYWLLYAPIVITLVLFAFTMIIKYFSNIKKIIFLKRFIKIFKNYYFKIILITTFLIATIVIYFFTNFLNMTKYIIKDKLVFNSDNKDYFQLNFENINIQSKKKNNLILVYVESFDTFFSNKEIFEEDLLRPIYENLQNSNGKILFDLRATPGANWTSASLVATQCGIPLKPLGLNNKNIILSKTFLKNHKCISDYLFELGDYHTEFISGSPLEFSNMYGFLTSHKFNKIYGKKELIKEGYKENPTGWSQSISDHDTFEFLKKRTLELKKKKKPFFINLLTIDTHKPGNFYDKKKCLKSNDKISIDENNVLNKSRFFKKYVSNFTVDEIYKLTQIYNQLDESKNDNLKDLKIAVKCTSNTINEFISFFNNNNFENTDLFIMGDHEYFLFQNKIKRRYIFNAYFGKNNFVQNRIEILQYDLFPFFLKLLGFKLEGNKHAFGIDPQSIVKTNIEKRLEKINKSIILDSKFYKTLW